MRGYVVAQLTLGLACPLGSGGEDCAFCPPGSFGEEGVCTLCPAGTFAPRSGSPACLTAPAGNFAALGAVKPTPCARGTFSLEGAAVCEPCPGMDARKSRARCRSISNQVYGHCVASEEQAEQGFVLWGASMFFVGVLVACVCLRQRRDRILWHGSWRPRTTACVRAHTTRKGRELFIASETILYPVALVPAAVFFAAKKLTVHERTAGLLFFEHNDDFNTFLEGNNRYIFFSHQWLSYTEPDPDGVQYRLMRVCAQRILDERGWSLADLHIWVDYMSVPQENRVLQSRAIDTLHVYASRAAFFIIIAPHTRHRDAAELCGPETYERRAWCRAEQLAHYCYQGAVEMYRSTAPEGPFDDAECTLQKIDWEWIQRNLLVFEGDMTCCRLKHPEGQLCDKEALVRPLIGLYCGMYLNRDVPQWQVVSDVIEQNRDELFPQTYGYVTDAGVERRPLFRDELTEVEQFVHFMEAYPESASQAGIDVRPPSDVPWLPGGSDCA